jgi:hypothetical protein
LDLSAELFILQKDAYQLVTPCMMNRVSALILFGWAWERLWIDDLAVYVFGDLIGPWDDAVEALRGWFWIGHFVAVRPVYVPDRKVDSSRLVDKWDCWHI